MKRQLIFIFLLTLFASCNLFIDKGHNKKQAKEVESEPPSETSEASTFKYNDFKIGKGQLGEIKIGMTISEAEQTFSGLRKETGRASSFGYGGGSPAYLYYDQNKVVFGLIPALNTNTVLFIIAASPRLSTTNRLSPNSTVGDISRKYPNIKVNQDLMNGWEYISDETHNWDFVFMTEEKTVGIYPELEVPSDLHNMDIKATWITIK